MLFDSGLKIFYLAFFTSLFIGKLICNFFLWCTFIYFKYQGNFGLIEWNEQYNLWNIGINYSWKLGKILCISHLSLGPFLLGGWESFNNWFFLLLVIDLFKFFIWLWLSFVKWWLWAKLSIYFTFPNLVKYRFLKYIFMIYWTSSLSLTSPFYFWFC